MDNEYSKYNEIAEILKIVAHPIRLCIINNLLKSGESNVTDMQACLGIPQSTLSSHLQKLRSAKLIEGIRKGLEVNYRIIDNDVAVLISALTINKIENSEI